MSGPPSDLQFAYTLAGDRPIRCDVIPHTGRKLREHWSQILPGQPLSLMSANDAVDGSSTGT
jgi:hypothetical protein